MSAACKFASAQDRYSAWLYNVGWRAESAEIVRSVMSSIDDMPEEREQGHDLDSIYPSPP